MRRALETSFDLPAGMPAERRGCSRLDSNCIRLAMKKRRALETTLDLAEGFAVKKRRVLKTRPDLPEGFAMK